MNLVPYQLVRLSSLLVAILSIIITVYLIARMRKKSHRWINLEIIEAEAVVLIVTIIIGLFAGVAYSGFVSIPQFVKTVGPGAGPHLPLSSSIAFFTHLNSFKQIDNIAQNPLITIPPIKRNTSRVVNVKITAQEVMAEIAPNITYNYWTFDGAVPGPFIRTRVGDTLEITLHNDKTSLHTHSIDFHAVTGPGGGANVLQVPPGETKTASFKLLNPGIYVYHCASQPSAAAHMTHGQYGLILVEPKNGLPPVDKEFYVMQGELYTLGRTGDTGLQAFDAQAMLDGTPTYVVFNGKVGGVNTMQAKVNDTVRIYIGNGGVNYVSSFHVIGEIFDTVYLEGSIGSPPLHNVQSTTIPAGGASIVEFRVNEPGNYILVDHALARVEKGAFGILKVTGKFNENIYSPMPATSTASASH